MVDQVTIERPIRITNCHDFDPEWRWIEPLYQGAPALEWRSISTKRSALVSIFPGPHLGRVRAALKVASILARGGTDMLVSHGPYTSYYMQALGRRGHTNVPHLAFAFNFTDIPEGYRLDAMRRAFASIDRFVVYSAYERDLYAATFGIPAERLSFMRWGVAPPLTAPQPRRFTEPYVAALGGEGRDYRTLCEAARLLPGLKFVMIVRPHSLSGIDIPPNVEVFVNLPRQEAWSIVWHSTAALIPLRSGRTPNGHVTLVGAMHIGKPLIITDSAGIRDYVQEGETGLLVPAQDAHSFAAAIERMMDDEGLRTHLGATGKAFAFENCSEFTTLQAVRELIVALTQKN